MTPNRDIIDEIKSRLDIVDVIGGEIKLHDDGGCFVGSVPPVGHSGKSLRVDRNLQLWHDTKNDKGGDVLDWIGRSYSDPRGKDFSEVLRVASEMAGVELAEMTTEEKERVDVYNLLTAATEIFHKNLTPELYDQIKKKWGITQETVDQLQIGYATACIEHLDRGTLQNSGLIYSRPDLVVLDHRIVFPYWKNGKVVYMIGRATPQTPYGKDNSEPPKYKKLLVNSEKKPHIKVQNSHFYGEDSLRGFDYCIITEGVTDCIVMLQAGFPCISPVTVSFREEDHPKLINLTKGLKCVYICNDNEDNGAGIAGALKTAGVLEQAGIEAKIIELPKATDVDKIDIADYMKGHSVDDFKALMVSSVRLWTYKLSKRKVPVTKLDKRRAFEDFIVDDLKGMPYADWELFVTNDATKHFGLNKKEAKPTIDKVRGSVKEFDFDLDSVSGRNAIYRAFADEYITEHHVKCINGKLRLYKDGVYPDSDEAIEFIQSEIMNIGLSQGVNLAENNIIAILRLIELSTRVRMTECEPDTSSVIVVNNGILHLDTWEIEEFSPDKIYFSKIPVDYVPNAGKPTMFNNYVDSCFKGNEAQKDLLQELFGYTLLKNYKYQNIFYLLGHGGNGKGIALSILGYLLGEHNYASESIHQLTDHSQVDYHVAKLHGKHANICGDISIKTIVNTETIKKLTSNTDPVAARNPYERPFSFVNYAKIIVALNRLPQTDAFTTGDKRRNLIISFNNKFSETDNEIKGLQCVIRDAGEMPGILLWAIEGLKRLEANQKFSDTRTIAQKAVEYEKKSRPARYYVEERLEELSGNLVPNALVYEDFNRFCVAIGAAELSQNEIKRSILQECYEAGWDVTNKITRVKSLPDLTQKLLPEIGLKQNSLRCFYGIAISKVEDQAVDHPLTTLELDILRFKEGHKVYQDVVKEIIPFVNDMMIDYPEHEFEEIRTAAMRLRSKGWKTPDGVEG